MPIRRSPRVVRKPTRTGRKLKQSFSAYGMDRLAAAYNKGFMGGRRGGKRKGWIAQDKAMIRSTTAEGGDYSQFTEKRIQTGYKKKVTLPSLVKEVRQKAETMLYRFGGMTGGGIGNGYFWCNKLVNDVNDSMPLYLFDLTSINNVVNGVTTTAQPLRRCKVSPSGAVSWDSVNGLNATGAVSDRWVDEKAPSTSTTLDFPHEKSRLLWTDVRLNLYGAKAKATKFIIQVIKLNDDCLDPEKAARFQSPSYEFQKHNAFYQGLLKPNVYNPLALTSAGQIAKNYKVLKTYTTIIQPTSTTESDTNPHMKILKWFMRWDRDINYVERGNFISTLQDFGNEADFAQQINQVSPYTKSRSKLWLMIRSTDYSGTQALNDNAKHASFDMTIRACHVPN